MLKLYLINYKLKKSTELKLLMDDLKVEINKLEKLDKSKKSDLVASLDKLY